MLTTTSVPLAETSELVLPYTVHWLFCNVPAVPGVSGPRNPLAASFKRYRALDARTYNPWHTFAVMFGPELTRKYRFAISAKPSASRPVKVNVCGVVVEPVGVPD